MWGSQSEKLPDHCGLRFAIITDARPATVGEVIRAWQGDPEFRSWFNQLLADTPYTAFRWETPGVSADRVESQAFEFVVLDSPGLANRPDQNAFAEYFQSAGGSVATFSNLGGDAILVVPCPAVEPSAYGHLAMFVRNAPKVQRDALWQAVGDAMTQRVGPKPVWLSTAGAGVPWLHVRLDDRPKYYGFAPYRSGK